MALLAKHHGYAVSPALMMSRKHFSVTNGKAHSSAEGSEQASTEGAGLFFEVDVLRLPAGGQSDFRTWGRGLEELVKGLLGRALNPLCDPRSARLAVIALGQDLRRLADFAAEIVATGSGDEAVLRQLEASRIRLIALAEDLAAAANSAAIPLEKELVDVRL